MPYKAQPDFATAQKVAEAVGRQYCANKSKSWPEAPDAYGPGRQPVPPAAYYQKYWQAPLPPWLKTDPTPPPGGTDLPARIEVDPTTQAMNGRQVVVTDGSTVTLDFTGLATTPTGTGT